MDRFGIVFRGEVGVGGPHGLVGGAGGVGLEFRYAGFDASNNGGLVLLRVAVERGELGGRGLDAFGQRGELLHGGLERVLHRTRGVPLEAGQVFV